MVRPVNAPSFASLGQALFEDAGEARLVLDPTQNILRDANPAAERLTGFRRAELRGMAFAHLVDYPQPEQWQPLQDAVLRTTPFHARDGYRLRTTRADV